MTTPLKALIQERLRAKLGRHEEEAGECVAEEVSRESFAQEPLERNGSVNSSMAFARPRSPEFPRHTAMSLPRRFPVDISEEDDHESSAFLPRHRRPRTHRHEQQQHKQHHHSHQSLARTSALEPRISPVSPWGSGHKGMHPHRHNQLEAKDNGDEVRGPRLASERMNRSHHQPSPAPASRPRFEPYKSRYEFDQQQQQQRRLGFDLRQERYPNPVAKSSMQPPKNDSFGLFRSSSSSQERVRYKSRVSSSSHDLERAKEQSIAFTTRSRAPGHHHVRVQSFRTVDMTVVGAYPGTEFPAAAGTQLMEPAGRSPDARSQPRVRSYESILSPDSRVAAKAFVDKRRRRAGSSTPRTMATQRWLQSLDAASPDDGRFFSPDIILSMRLPTYQSSGSGHGSAMQAPSSTRSLSLRIVSALGASMLLLGLIVQLSTLQHALHQEFQAAASTTRMDTVDAIAQQQQVTEVADPLQSAIFRHILDALSPASSFVDAKDDQAYIAIAFGSQNVVSGDYVPMNIAEDAPSLSLHAAGDGIFTWILIDIDAPDPANPAHAPFLHMIVANLLGNQSSAQPALTVVPYYPVSPPIGQHRYVSMLFRQDELQAADEQQQQSLAGQRSKFNVPAYAATHALALADTTYFYSQPQN